MSANAPFTNFKRISRNGLRSAGCRRRGSLPDSPCCQHRDHKDRQEPQSDFFSHCDENSFQSKDYLNKLSFD